MATKVIQYRWNYQDSNGNLETYPDGWEVGTNADKVQVPLDLGENEAIIKLAIQAPVGTRVEINGNTFLIGQFEALEFNCADMKITSFYILGNKKANLNQQETQKLIEEGLADMDAALTTKLNNSNTSISLTLPADAQNIQGENGVEVVTYTTDGENVQTTLTSGVSQTSILEAEFLDAYTAGYNKYLQGLRGVYETSANNVNEVKNVIIDILIKEGGNE